MPTPRPYSIKIFVPEGEPDGLRIIERSNWTGEGFFFSRSGFKEYNKTRKEFHKAGVYILVGNPDDSSFPSVYIGESESIGERLADHNIKKDFWTWCIFFVSKDNSLNKAHVKFLESRLIEQATKAKRCNLTNNKEPARPQLSEADAADMECFYEDMLSIFPLAGLSIFEEPSSESCAGNKFLYINSKGIKAKGCESNKGFVVMAKSEAVLKHVPSYSESLINLRNELSKKGVLIEKENRYIFSDNYIFSSPSTASSVVLGRSSNGRVDWKDKTGKTLKALQKVVVSAGSDSD